jgi:tetratricopeptide (TPR) repeat protein
VPPAIGGPPWPVRALVALALVAATLAAFAGVRHNGWILFDDPGYVIDNPHVVHGFTPEAARWFLHAAHGANWHPLTSYSHLLDVTLFGLNAGAHHVMSLGLHALTALLLLLVLHRLTGAWWRSVAVAALFALHPLRVESVAWAAERKDVLSGLFFVLTLEAYRRWALRPGAARMTLTALALALGLLAKPMLVTTPFLLVLLDVWPLGRLDLAGRRRGRALADRVLEKWPLIALSLALAVVTFLVQRESGATNNSLLPVSQRISNALVSWARYVGKSLWPAGLTVFYPHPRRVEWLAASLSLLGLAAASWLAWRERGRRPWLLVGWLWFIGTLMPVIGLLQVGRQSWADRYTYLPTIGLAIALAWTLGEWGARSRAARVGLAVALLAACAALGTATARQVARWRDTRTLFTWTLSLGESNAVAHMCLGDLEMKAGRPAPAIAEYRAALRAEPDYDLVRNNLASALAMTGRRAEARAEFEEAMRHGRPSAETWHNLGLLDAQEGRYAEAAVAFERALRIDPKHLPSHVKLAAAYGALGRLADAETHWRAAVELSGGSPGDRRLLAETLKRERRPAEALEQYEAILRAVPDDIDALVNAAWIRATFPSADLRDGAAAVRMAERAKAKSPEPLAIVEATLAAAYAESGRFGDAVDACARALKLARAAHADDEAAGYAAQLACYRDRRPFRVAP